MDRFFSLRLFVFCLSISFLPILLKAQDDIKGQKNDKKEKTAIIKQNDKPKDKGPTVKANPGVGKPDIKQVPKSRKQPKPKVVQPKIKPKIIRPAIKVKPIKGPRLK